MPKVSIIIPAYNAEKYIVECVNAVLNQTLDDIEAIIIDDGSTDKTGVLIDELTKDISFAKVIHQENKGLYKTREIGLSLATGDYVGWIDADDYPELNMFEVLYNAAMEHDSELVICDYSWFPEKISTKEKWFREYKGKADVSFVERNSQPWNKIVKRDLLLRLNIGPHFVSCFDEIYIRILMEAKNPVTIQDSLYNYRVGNGTMSSSYTNVNHYRRFVIASRELQKVMNDVISDSYWRDYFNYRVIYYLLMTMIVAANSKDKASYKINHDELMAIKPVFTNNQHFWPIMKENYGPLKSFAIGRLIPVSYSIANLICRIGLK